MTIADAIEREAPRDTREEGSSPRRHVLDRGETQEFHAPVFAGLDSPRFLRFLEFGCELAYVKQQSTEPPDARTINGLKLLSYTATDGKYRINLAVDEAAGTPYALGIFKNGDLVHYVRYLEYQRDLAPEPGLFQPPEGIQIEEATQTTTITTGGEEDQDP